MREQWEAVPAVLSEAEISRVLSGVVLPSWAGGAVPQEEPVVLLVAGPPGSGKTTLGDLLMPVLSRRGGAVRVGADLYKSAHRHYKTLLAKDVRTAGVGVRADTRRWQAAVEEHVRAHRLDAVVETALADPDEARAQALAYRAAGHRIEVIAVACALAWSQLGVLERYLGNAEGAGRWVSWANHDECARQLARTLGVLEEERLVDRVMVVRRGLEPLYSNELIDGTWVRLPGAARAVEAERARWWGAVETACFRRSLAGAERALVRAETRLPADRVLAVVRDAERCAALAEPVRRTAQPIPGPPGVDYHRLSADEHEWTYLNLIVPDLGEIVAQERPVVVYVMGAPGAGKTQATVMVRRALRERRAVWISGGMFKAAHPDYFRLLREHPRTASARIRADYKAWQARAEAYVRERRADAVIEVAPGSADAFLADAAAWRRAGYRVELLVLDVRAADSRQGTALRYAEVSRGGTRPGRFTTASGHDRCLAAVLECVQAVEEQRLVDHLSVVRRDGTAVFRNTLGPHGRWAGPAGAALAARAGQVRPYTEQEARQFLADQRELRIALPQYRRDVDAITRLAWPLLPPALQPGRLAFTPPAALPAQRGEQVRAQRCVVGLLEEQVMQALLPARPGRRSLGQRPAFAARGQSPRLEVVHEALQVAAADPTQGTARAPACSTPGTPSTSTAGNSAGSLAVTNDQVPPEASISGESITRGSVPRPRTHHPHEGREAAARLTRRVPSPGRASCGARGPPTTDRPGRTSARPPAPASSGPAAPAGPAPPSPGMSVTDTTASGARAARVRQSGDTGPCACRVC
ncbi:Zeta toxin family protein [Streptomyces sp. CB01881]|nr:Zeta toxin family protein [Streptomyces sp. CB01881]TYC68856.1 Zeta toxin family protein [Streptomyces sp. CB01881]